MDNSWLGHCGSMWQSASLPESHLQLQHTGQNFYPYISQDSVLLGNGIVQQCAHPWGSNSTADNSSHAEFNGSFVTFLSGPLPSLQGELQQLSKVSTTNEKLINCNNANGSASGNGPVLVPAAKLSQYFSSHKLSAGQTVKPTAVIIPPKREMDRPAVYVGNEKLKHSAFPRGVADSAVDDNDMPDIVTSRKLFPDTGSFGQLSPPLSSYPRVFCLGTSGYLLLKNTGLLGVICLCHDSHMSVSRFCEHSGLSNVNPGNAVRMDSGVTIAQWRKVFFQKLGIKAPEDHAEWDWHEVSPVTTGWGEFYPSLPNYSPTSELLGGFRSSNGAGLSGNNVSVSKNPLNFQEDVDLVHNVKQTSEFSGSSCSTLKSRLFHVTDMELKSCSYPQLFQGQENGSSFISAYIGSSSTDTNSLPDLTISESLGINSALMQMNTSSISSNIELSLGHPSQQSKKLGTLAQQAFEYHPIVKPSEYQQSFFPDLCMHKALESRAMEGSRSNFHMFDLSPKCGKDQLDLVNSYGVYKATSESRTRNSVFPMLQAHFNGPSEGMLYSAATKSRADEPQSESLSLKRDQIDFGDNRQFNTDTSCVLGHVNGDKGVGEKNVNLRFATDSSRYNVNNSSVVKGIVHSNHSALQEKNLYSCKPCPDNWNNLNLCGKTSLISRNGPCDSGNVRSFCKPMDSREAPLTQAVQLGFSLSSSTLIKHQALQSSNKETLEGRQFELTQNSRTQTLHHGFTDLGTHVQTIAPITDQLEGCNISPLLHAGSLRAQDSQLHCQHTTDVNAVHWPYVRHGGLESNITPSVEQAKCFLVAPSSFMSYHCSCSVQPGTSAETHHLIGEPPHSTQREQNRTSGCKKHNTFACMLEDDSHKFALNNVAFLDENSNLVGQKKNKLVCHSSQWRDVPKKANEAVSLTRKEQRATFLNMNERKRGQKADAGGKKFYCDVAFRKVECPKEPEMSNVSSGGSGPVVTEASAQNNVVVDEGSGIDRCWSSNDAQGSEQSSDFFAGPSKTSRSLMDELRLRDSLRSKKLQNQFGFSIQEKNNCIQKVADISKKVIRKKTKWRQLDTAFTASACGYPGGTCGAGLQSHSCKGKGVPRLDYGSAEECAYCVEPSCRGRRRVRMHSLETLSCNSKINCNETKIIGSQSNPVKVGDDDNFETCELPRRKRLRSDTSSAFRHIDKGDDLGEEASAECSLVDSSSMFSEIHEKVRERAVRPIVCEKYGVICNGNQSKPVKFGSLRNICDSLAKCSSTITKTSSAKFRKVIAKGKCRRINKSLNLKKVGSCNAQRVTTTKNSICSPEKRRYDCLMKTGTIADDSVPVQQKPKSKEIQIWGLYEPTLEGMLPTTRFSKGHFSDNNLVGKVDIHPGQEAPTCARTEGYKGRKKEGVQYNFPQRCGGSLVAQEQLNAWIHITGHKSSRKEVARLPPKDAEYDYRKEYARYKHSKGWKSLVVYKSGIHALGLYTARFISQGAMVVEYVGEIVGLRVADRREVEYLSGKKLQYKSACYFFRIDQEHIVDATQKGGIARFVNHSCLPNCVARIISVRNEKKVVFFAERDIYPGEEITYDYNFNHEDEGKKIPCYCNANKCRRYLN